MNINVCKVGDVGMQEMQELCQIMSTLVCSSAGCGHVHMHVC